MSLGENIRIARKYGNLTQAELARLSGLSKSFISEVEHDKTNISVKNLVKIASVLHVSVTLDELVKGNVCPCCGQKLRRGSNRDDERRV